MKPQPLSNQQIEEWIKQRTEKDKEYIIRFIEKTRVTQ